MKYFLILTSWLLLSNINSDVPSLSYEQLKPMLHQTGDKVYVVNFWATWCAPCIKELPYFESINQREDVEVILVSLDFPKHKTKRLLPFVKKHKLKSKVVHLDDTNENYWINDIAPQWSGAIPATIIYKQKQRKFYEQSFTLEQLNSEIDSFL